MLAALVLVVEPALAENRFLPPTMPDVLVVTVKLAMPEEFVEAIPTLALVVASVKVTVELAAAGLKVAVSVQEVTPALVVPQLGAEIASVAVAWVVTRLSFAFAEAP